MIEREGERWRERSYTLVIQSRYHMYHNECTKYSVTILLQPLYCNQPVIYVSNKVPRYVVYV